MTMKTTKESNKTQTNSERKLTNKQTRKSLKVQTDTDGAQSRPLRDTDVTIER